ncbi:6,7-dimethyl-8-ribityllumazine synthase [Liberibacter sp. Z1]|nr:6,7-dimethyl-8-ribityllumazine synthase [Candidatus Liberibacter sp.]MBA5723594.1 6,7-dimethyl-8-ribityllumazine synthase [Candidatus Liberibacter sp.]
MSTFVPRVLIVEARFYDRLSFELLEGCMAVLREEGIPFDSVVVPGVLEIPTAISMAMSASKNANGVIYGGFVALGIVIKGETSHFDIVSRESTRGLVDLSIKHSLPIGNGILVVDNEEQAWERASFSRLNRGGFAAHAVLKMIELKQNSFQ